MTRFALIAFALLLSATAAPAQPTPEQRSACEQDAHRLCPDAVPDEAKVRKCLASKMRRLNPVCRSAFQKKAVSKRRLKKK